MARSNGKVYDLTQAQRAISGRSRDKLHQFLSEIGVKALRQHLGQLLGIARIAKDRDEYERYVQRLLGRRLDCSTSPSPTSQLQPSSQ